MRIVKFAEFLTMQPGTVYSDYSEGGNFGPLCVKLDTAGNPPVDFFYTPLSDLGAQDSEDTERLLVQAQETGASVPMVFDTVCREGIFDHGAMYAVWADADVIGLAQKLLQVAWASE